MATEATGMPEAFHPEDMHRQLLEERKQWAAVKTKGQRFAIEREGMSLAGCPKDPVNTILYFPAERKAGAGKLPVLFNMHGGAWIGGDAVLMESFCQLIADQVPCMVVNVNYKKADERRFPYQIEEISDAVEYLAAHADEYGIDPEKMGVGGHSAGAHLAAGSTLMLAERGVNLAVQMLVYPCLQMVGQSGDLSGLMAMLSGVMFGDNAGDFAPDGRFASPLLASDEVLRKTAPAIFVECGPDDLKPQGIAYAKRLIDLGKTVCIREWPAAEHGFLEVNRPEYPDADPRKRPDQAAMARECEQYLIAELRRCFA